MNVSGRKQSNLKQMNRRAILSVLSESDLSCMDLSKKLNLSYTGIDTLVEEMVKDKILFKYDAETATRGRRPILISITDKCAIICVVTFRLNCSFSFFNLRGEELYKKSFEEKQNISQDDIIAYINVIQDILNDKFSLSKLVCIYISAPGRIDKDTGAFAYSPYFIDYDKWNMKTMMIEKFDTMVEIKNNLKYTLSAEKFCGKHRELIYDTLYLEVNPGVGCSMFLSGELYEGKHGMGGEIGFFNLEYLCNEQTTTLTNKHLHQYVSFNHIALCVTNRLKNGELSSLSQHDNVSIEDIAKAYIDNDRLVSEVVESTITIIGKVIASMLLVLDFDNVFISKQSNIFGDKYLEGIKKVVKQNTFSNSVEIYYSSFYKDSEVIGAKKMAIEYAIGMLANKV